MDIATDALLDAKYEAALLHQKEGRLQDAATGYFEILNLRADYIPAAIKYGQLLSQVGKYDDAVKVLNHALRYAPHSSKIYNDLGQVLIKRGDTINGIIAFENAIAVDPGEALSYFNLGSVYLV